MTRLVLRSDVVVRRLFPQPQGFTISTAEKRDYHLAMQYFRDAQRAEMEKKKELADQLYQRSLSLRYLYPRALVNSQKAGLVVECFPPNHVMSLFPGISD
jgi:hypothetical protein